MPYLLRAVKSPLYRRLATEPSEKNFALVNRDSIWLRPLMRTLIRPNSKVTCDGRENIPRVGPALILSNHVNILDPIFMIMAAGRNIHWLATESSWDERIPAFLCTRAGAVPRKKFVTDSKSIRHLRAWKEHGGLVGLFPEGERTWDGTPLPFQPGIDKLVRLIGAPVITARVINGYRQKPRWAQTTRSCRVHIEFDPPVTFDRKTDSAQMIEHIRRRLHVDPSRGEEFPIRGRNLAVGIANLLFACPNCHRIDALAELGDNVLCRSCGAGYRVDPNNTLHPVRGGDPIPLPAAIDAMKKHLAIDWVADPKRFAADRTILESEPMELFLVGAEAASLGRGKLRMTPERLTFHTVEGELRWSISMPDLRAVAVDMSRRLQFRDKDSQAFEAVMPHESALKWYWIGEYWRRRAAVPDLNAPEDRSTALET